MKKFSVVKCLKLELSLILSEKVPGGCVPLKQEYEPRKNTERPNRGAGIAGGC